MRVRNRLLLYGRGRQYGLYTATPTSYKLPLFQAVPAMHGSNVLLVGTREGGCQREKKGKFYLVSLPVSCRPWAYLSRFSVWLLLFSRYAFTLYLSCSAPSLPLSPPKIAGRALS